MNINTAHEYSIQLLGSRSIIYTNLILVFFLLGILKVLIGQVSTGKKKLTIEHLSPVAIKPRKSNTIYSLYSICNTINLEAFHLPLGPELPSNCGTQI